MYIKESGEMYLETIYILSKQEKIVRAINVSEYMGYSKPSVSRALGILKEGRYITIDTGGALHLTEKGLEKAEKIYERHTVLSSFLKKIGVDEKNAAADACKIEHVISDETFKKLKDFFEK